MSDRHHEVDMPYPFAAYFFLGHFHATTVADDAFIANAFVFTTSTFIVLYGTKDTLTEQPVAFRFVSTVVDSFEFSNQIGRAHV